MGLVYTLALLLVAASLEAGGDAVVRIGLHSHQGVTRVLLFAAGALVLFAYGVSVNTPPWDFGRLLGVYVTLFFLVAQVINAAVFGTPPTMAIIIGGLLIIAGGMLITFWHN